MNDLKNILFKEPYTPTKKEMKKAHRKFKQKHFKKISPDLKNIIKNEGYFYNFSYKGFFCTIQRNPELLNLLAYVKITKLSPKFYKKDCFDDDIFDDLNVYGGLNYSGPSAKWWQGIKYNSKDWYIGFDCGHYRDIVPIYTTLFDINRFKTIEALKITYKNINFCIFELKFLINQILDLD